MRFRCGVVVCPVWRMLEIQGDFEILIHYVRGIDGVATMTAAYSRYNGVLTNISDKIRTLKLVPDWDWRHHADRDSTHDQR
jgi:hypothetical protein